ncbi:unnamed protein product, partial [Urochloa humidicola]
GDGGGGGSTEGGRATRYKVLVPWRFKRGFFREPLKHAPAPAAAAAAPGGGSKTVGDPDAENCGSGGAPSGGGESVRVREAKNCGSGGAPSGGKTGEVGGGEPQSEGCAPSQSL